MLRALLLAVCSSLAATLLAIALALVPATILARGRRSGRHLLRSLISFPRTFPGILLGLLVLLDQAGAVPGLRDLSTGRGSFLSWLALAYFYFEVPRVALTLESAFRDLPSDLDDAARTLGASPLERLLWVTLPLSTAALRSTVLATFAASLGAAGVVLMLSPLDAAGGLCLLMALLALGAGRLSSRGRLPA